MSNSNFEIIPKSIIEFKTNGEYTIAYSEPFTKSEYLHIILKLAKIVSLDNILFGIMADEHKDSNFWFDSGNQIDIK